MKFDITNWIETGSIAPLQWGDSGNEIIKLFPKSSKIIKQAKQIGCPFISLDFVELYFDDDYFLGLNEIIIRPFTLHKDDRHKFFDPGWLSKNLTFDMVSKKLTSKGVQWEISRGPDFNTPNIVTGAEVLLAFEPYRTEDSLATLQKIYIFKNGLSSNPGYLAAGNKALPKSGADT